MRTGIRLVSRAKINLFLEIRGRLDDQYHELITLYHEIDLADEILISRIDEPYCVLRCNDSAVPFGKRNLCIKAFDAMHDIAGLNQRVEITLNKTIPLGSGLGGGSSNAAAIITGINKLFRLGLSVKEMENIASNVGSDVPFFISGGAAVGRGRGNRLQPVTPFPTPLHLVLLTPSVSISTKTAFQWVEGYAGKSNINAAELSRRMADGDLEYLMRRMKNAFEPIVYKRHPALGRWKETLEEAGCLKAMLTGSGSAIYGICENRRQAVRIAESLKDEDGLTLVTACRTVT